MFELPTGFVSGIGSNATDALAALSPTVQLILGILLAAVVIGIILNSFHKH